LTLVVAYVSLSSRFFGLCLRHEGILFTVRFLHTWFCPGLTQPAQRWGWWNPSWSASRWQTD